MSSSISSSDALSETIRVRAPSRAARVLLVLALVLLGVEALARLKLIRMSKEFQRFGTYAGRAGQLARSDAFRVAVVGSSITHEDIDPAIFAARLHGLRGLKVVADVFSADHSYVNTWRYMLERYFWRPGNRVDLVVVPFIATGLYDGNEVEVGRLAQFFTSLADWPEVLGADLRTTAQRADFVASTLYASFAARERMRELVFTSLLPGYKRFATNQQAILLLHKAAQRAARPRPVQSLDALARLLRAAQAHGTRLVFVAFPTQHAEWTDPYTEARRLIEQDGMDYRDLRPIPEIDTASYLDMVHLNAAGRAVFSRRLADTLAALVRPGGAVADGTPSAASPGS